MSLTLAASTLSSQARTVPAPRGGGPDASARRACPTPFVAARPRCSLAFAAAPQTRPQRLPYKELCQRRQQRAALLRCAAEASSDSSSDARQPQQEPAATAALVLSSSDDERVPDLPASSSSSSGDGDSGAAASSAPNGGSEGGSESGDDDAVRIDLQLPRRSLLVQFTCNVCGGRSERLCNPIAWQKGLVIAQCQHCPSWHKLADAANLVEEIRYADLEDDE